MTTVLNWAAGSHLTPPPGVEAAAAAPVFVVGMPFVRRPRLASALDKLALTDSLLKLRRPLKLFGTFIGRPSIILDL